MSSANCLRESQFFVSLLFSMKLKTKKAAAKRFRFSATGKVKFQRTGRRHNLSKHSNVKMLSKRACTYMIDGDAKHVRKCLPYGN